MLRPFPPVRVPRAVAFNAQRLPHLVRLSAAALALAAAASLAACRPPATVYGSRASDADSLARSIIAREQTINAASIPQNTLSVAPLAVLSPDTSYSAIGYGMASLLVTDLARSARLTLVERLKIDAVLRELELAQSGRVDTLTAPRVGKLVGARQVVVGTIDLRAPGNLRLQSYVANTVTGKVGSSLNGNATLAQIFDAEKTLAFRLFDVLGVTLTPAERRLVEQHATRSLVAFLAFSRGTRAEAFKDFPTAAANYAEAVRLDPNFGLAAERRTALQGPTVAAVNSATALNRVSAINRAAAISAGLVNRATPGTIGTAADVPFSSQQQLITFTIIIRTP